MNFKPKNWNDPQSVARAAIRLTHAAMDAAFNESDHPRDEDGKFGSGGGGESKKVSLSHLENKKGMIDINKVFENKIDNETLTILKSFSEEKLWKAPSYVEHVSPKNIFSTPGQHQLNAEGVEEYIDGTNTNEEFPLVYRVNNKLVLIDGNHRVAAALLTKQKSIKIKIVDLDN